MIIALVAALAASPAAPPPKPAPPAVAGETHEPDAETFAAALALFDSADLNERLLATTLEVAQSSLDTEIEADRKRGIEFPSSLRAQLNQLVLWEVKVMVDEITPTFRTEAATVYARYFSAEELRELKRLQSNPVAQKLQRLTPQLSGELSRIGSAKAAEHMPDIRRKTEALIKEWLKDQELGSHRPES